MSLLIIDIRNLSDVIKELTSTQHLSCAVWYDLGLQLGLYDNTLKDIKANYEDVTERFRECMSAWLRGEDNVKETEDGPSWLSLVSALKTIGEHCIAANIKDTQCEQLT